LVINKNLFPIIKSSIKLSGDKKKIGRRVKSFKKDSKTALNVAINLVKIEFFPF